MIEFRFPFQIIYKIKSNFTESIFKPLADGAIKGNYSFHGETNLVLVLL